MEKTDWSFLSIHIGLSLSVVILLVLFKQLYFWYVKQALALLFLKDTSTHEAFWSSCSYYIYALPSAIFFKP